MNDFLSCLERARLATRTTQAIVIVPQKELLAPRTIREKLRKGCDPEELAYQDMVARNNFWLVDLMQRGIKHFFTKAAAANVFGHDRGTVSKTINVILVLALGRRPDENLAAQIESVKLVSDTQGAYQSSTAIRRLIREEARWHVAHRPRMEALPPADNLTRGADEYPDRLLSAITAVQV